MQAAETVSATTRSLRAPLRGDARTPLAAVAATPDLLETLYCAVHSSWSGEILMEDGDGPVGRMVLLEGRIAWAVCREQREHLGAFLRRSGRIDRTQLQQIDREYQRHQGRRKVGEILEDLGIVTREELRELLRRHTAMAVGALLDRPLRPLRLSVQPGHLDAAREHTFTLGEVLAEPLEGALTMPPEEPPGRNAALQTVLRQLADVGGFQVALVVASPGTVVAGYPEPLPIRFRGASLLLSAGLRLVFGASRHSELGRSRSFVLEAEEGGMVAFALDERCARTVLLVLDPTGQVGAARRRLAAIVPELEALMAAPAS
jgi:hypothetical protein